MPHLHLCEYAKTKFFVGHRYATRRPMVKVKKEMEPTKFHRSFWMELQMSMYAVIT